MRLSFANLFILAAVVGLCRLVFAQGPVAPVNPERLRKAPQGGKKDEEAKEVNIQAERARYDDKKKVTVFTGNVSLRQTGEDFTMRCDQIDYNADTDVGVAKGHLQFEDPDTTITGDVVTANFSERRLTTAGNVRLVARGKPERGEAKSTEGEKEKEKEKGFREQWKEKQTVVTCDVLDYEWRAKVATASGNLKIQQKDRTAFADRVIYQEKEDLVIMEGNVKVLSAEGESLSCSKATISVRDDWIEAEGVSSVFLVDKEKKKEGAKKSEGEKAGTPKPEEKSPTEPSPASPPSEQKPNEEKKESPPQASPGANGQADQGKDKGQTPTPQ